MTYFTYIKNSEDELYINNQKENIDSYKKKENIDTIKDYQSDSIEYKKIDNYLERNVIDELDYANALLISDLSALGNSAFKILERILKIKEKKITLHITKIDFILPFNNEDLYKVIKATIDSDKNIKKKRVKLAEATRNENNTKIGRREGKKTKSRFDKHKSEIFKLYKLEVPIPRILSRIVEKDDSIQGTSPQALRHFIKKTEETIAKKENAKKAKQEDIKKKNAEKFNSDIDKSLVDKFSRQQKGKYKRKGVKK